MASGTIVTDRTIQAFSWMLVHSLWQGLLFAVVIAVLLVFCRKATAGVRYAIVLVLFLLFLMTSVSTLIYEWKSLQPVQYSSKTKHSYKGVTHLSPQNKSFTLPGSQVLTTTATPETSTIPSRNYLKVIANYLSEHSFFIVMLWFIFFIVKSVSLAANLVGIQRARHYRIFEPPEYWQEHLQALCKKLRLQKAVQLFESGYVKMPVVVGHLKPFILVPVGLLAALPQEQGEAMLLHELAHIRRNDYIVNFLQNIAEAIFFFNPGLLWVSALLREERENCCDDIAIAEIHNKEEFVKALISFKEYSVAAQAFSLAFADEKNPLVNRIMRIVSVQVTQKLACLFGN